MACEAPWERGCVIRELYLFKTDSFDTRQNLGLINLGIGFCFAMGLPGVFTFPVFDKHKRRRFAFRLIDVKPQAAWLGSGQTAGFG